MGNYSDVVDITITVQAVTPSGNGFGEPLFLAADCPAGFTQRVRHYFGPGPTALAQMVTDGFSTTGASYLAAEAAFAQNPSPVSVAIGKLLNKPTQIYTVAPGGVASSQYAVTIDGMAYSATAPASLATDVNASVTALTNAIGSLSGLTIAGVAGPAAVLTHSSENGTAISTFVGAQTLTAQSSTAGFAASGTVSIVTSGGVAVIAYTGITGSTFTNCTLVSGTGTWTMVTGDAINQFTAFTVTATVAGAFHTLSINNSSLLTLTRSDANAGMAADLAAINAYDSTWYAINCDAWASAVNLAAVALFTEANQKLHVSCTVDSNCANLAEGVGSDVMQTLQASSYARTATIYAEDTSQFTGAAWLGSRLPLPAGSENWKFASLAGVAVVKLTGTQVANITAKSGNYYYPIGAINITANGNTANGSFIDLTRGRDWFAQRLQQRIVGILTSTDEKIPFTDQGISQVEAEVRGQCDEAILRGFLAANPAPIVTAPTAASVDSTDRSNRNLPGVTFQGQSAGAINKVAVSGVVLL